MSGERKFLLTFYAKSCCCSVVPRKQSGTSQTRFRAPGGGSAPASRPIAMTHQLSQADSNKTTLLVQRSWTPSPMLGHEYLEYHRLCLLLHLIPPPKRHLYCVTALCCLRSLVCEKGKMSPCPATYLPLDKPSTVCCYCAINTVSFSVLFWYFLLPAHDKRGVSERAVCSCIISRSLGRAL